MKATALFGMVALNVALFSAGETKGADGMKLVVGPKISGESVDVGTITQTPVHGLVTKAYTGIFSISVGGVEALVDTTTLPKGNGASTLNLKARVSSSDGAQSSWSAPINFNPGQNKKNGNVPQAADLVFEHTATTQPMDVSVEWKAVGNPNNNLAVIVPGNYFKVVLKDVRLTPPIPTGRLIFGASNAVLLTDNVNPNSTPTGLEAFVTRQ